MPIAFLKRIARGLAGARLSPPATGNAPARTGRPPEDDHPGRRRRRRRKPDGRNPQGRTDHAAAHKAASRPGGEWTRADYRVPQADGRLRFPDLDLTDTVLHGIADRGFLYCTPVQEQVLTRAGSSDLTGRAQTGTGKTAAFLILMFDHFVRNPRLHPAVGPARPRALIIAPTRELVVQIVEEAAALGKYANIRSVAVYGGTDLDRQAHQLAPAVDLVAATPGRLLDFASRGVIDLSRVEVFVVDEADRMLDMGFIPDVRRIVSRLPPKADRRTLLFSATLTEEVRNLASRWMSNPVVVEVEPEKVAVETVEHIVFPVASRLKYTLLWNLLHRPDYTRVLVFTNRRDRTRDVAERLNTHGVRCEMISGDVQQNRRLNILNDFRDGRLPVLIATDVAGRGIHVDDVSHVINYDFPYDAEDYVHRIGRTGRAGNAGTAVSFACEDESFVIPEIEKYMGRALPCMQPPEELLKPPPSLPSHAHRTTHAAGQRPRHGGTRHSGGRPRHSRYRRA